MRLTQHTDYALRVLIYLGVNPDDLSTIRQISDSYGISKNHLMKVVQRLVQEGYIASIRGQRGGLRLKMAPTEITLGELVLRMEPDFALVECKRAANNCVITGACRLPGILDTAITAFIAELNKHTLSDLIPAAKRGELLKLLEIG